MHATSIPVRFRLAFVGALVGLAIAGSHAFAAPVKNDEPAPSCAGGFKPVCKKPIIEGVPPNTKVTGCSEWRCEMPKASKWQQSRPIKQGARPIKSVR